MKWLFKVGNNLYIKQLDLINLEAVNNYIGNVKKDTGFIILENTLINVNLIELICEAELCENGTIRL